MTQIGIMIEAQEGLNWEQWRRLCRDVEELGFASLRRSDHLMSVFDGLERDALDCWASLALAAEWTTKIEFGSMVSPLSWHSPVILARQAAAVDVLSDGRLIFGVGAGWFASEHDQFGLSLAPLKQRLDNYESGIETILRTWQLTNPKPRRNGRVPILLGGRGEGRGLRIIATYADEWNVPNAELQLYQRKVGAFVEHCRAVGRDPSTVRRSTLHGGYLIGANEREVLERAAKVRTVLPELKELEPREVLEALPTWFAGTPDQIVEKMKGFIESGVDLFMLTHLLLDDREGLELLAEVIPGIA